MTRDHRMTRVQADGRPGQRLAEGDIGEAVQEALTRTPVIDIHTHLFAPAFGDHALWGIDNVLTYHYLEAELFRFAKIHPEQYWALSKPQRADLIWRTLFVENSPLSESARGVIAVLDTLGLDSTVSTLRPLREFFRDQNLKDYLPRILELAGVSAVVMTNDPLDPEEAPLWERGIQPDPRFHAALRIDRIVNEWSAHWEKIVSARYAVEADAEGRTLAELRRFLEGWSQRMRPVYMAVSLPDSFQFPAADLRTRLLTGAVLPACRDLNLPLALMIGVRRQANPLLNRAGDASGKCDLRALETMCRDFPEQRFLVTVLSRENQHELCVYARKFSNLMPFGCWWFLNNPSIVEEITRERLEMLGVSFIPQHSDAVILEQLIYKWKNTRRTLAPILTSAYQLLAQDGRPPSRDEVRRDVRLLLRGNFERRVFSAG